MFVFDLILSFGWQKSPVIEQKEVHTPTLGEEPPNEPVYSEVWYSESRFAEKDLGPLVGTQSNN